MTSGLTTSPRGDCPSLARPMMTGDGLLLRLTPTAPMPPPAWGLLADVADGLGNGQIDLTIRGAVQVRGLRAETVAAAQQRLLSAGFMESRPVLVTDPLGLDDRAALGDSHALAARIAALLSARPLSPGLAPKVTVAIDAARRLDDVPANLRLRWRDRARVALCIGGGNLVECVEDEAPHLVWDCLEAMARTQRRGRAHAAALGLTMAEDGRGQPLSLGPVGRGIHILAPAFGALSATQLRTILHLPGLTALRAAAGRRLVLWGLAPDMRVPDFLAGTDDDPRLAISACPGAPACASALSATRPLARLLADGGGIGAAHLSGCAKGCGAPDDGTPTATASHGGWVFEGHDTSRLAAALASRGERLRDAL